MDEAHTCRFSYIPTVGGPGKFAPFLHLQILLKSQNAITLCKKPFLALLHCKNRNSLELEKLAIITRACVVFCSSFLYLQNV